MNSDAKNRTLKLFSGHKPFQPKFLLISESSILSAVLGRRRLLQLLGVCSLFLLIYSSVRAYVLSFVFDEATSYSMISGEHPEWKQSASNHPLNTRLMSWMYHVAGPAEWALRLPNVVAHALYLVFGLLLLRRLSNSLMIILGFVVLNLNPFMLDFFSVARGYGLALGWSMAALYFLRDAVCPTPSPRAEIFLTLSLVCASLADLSNFFWLNFHLAMLAAAGLILYDRLHRSERSSKRVVLTAAILLPLGTAWFLRNLIPRVLKLSAVGDFYFGGKDGFVTDTIGSLVQTYFYRNAGPPRHEFGIVIVITTAVIALAVALAITAWKRREFSFAVSLLTIFALSVAAPVSEHTLLGTLYPLERVALGYVPLTGLLVVFGVDQILSKGWRERRITSAAVGTVSAMLILAMVTHFATTANLSHTLTWDYDSDTKTAVMEIPNHFDVSDGQVVRIDSHWALQQSINYYRSSLNFKWLQPVTEGSDVFYGPLQTITEHGISHYTILHRYTATGNLLVRVEK
jgi:hypothetical protein